MYYFVIHLFPSGNYLKIVYNRERVHIYALVVQWIGHEIADLKTKVRFLARAHNK